jgi:hypothetical protein
VGCHAEAERNIWATARAYSERLALTDLSEALLNTSHPTFIATGAAL